MMKIAILLLNKGRGSGEVAREHVRHLLKLGHKVYFLETWAQSLFSSSRYRGRN